MVVLCHVVVMFCVMLLLCFRFVVIVVCVVCVCCLVLFVCGVVCVVCVVAQTTEKPLIKENNMSNIIYSLLLRRDFLI